MSKGTELVMVDRTLNYHLTSGWGIRFCVGVHLARSEETAFSQDVLHRKLRFEVAGDGTLLRHTLFRGLTALPVVVPSR